MDDLLAPYEEGTNNPDYLEFVDMEESARLEYLTQTMLCVKMPDGRILPHIPAYSPICTRSTMERCTNAVAVPPSPQTHKRQSGSSWLIIRSEAVPHLKGIRGGFLRVPVFRGGGRLWYYHNPDAKWDWYEIGGRWPYRFLVKSDCPSALPGVAVSFERPVHTACT